MISNAKSCATSIATILKPSLLSGVIAMSITESVMPIYLLQSTRHSDCNAVSLHKIFVALRVRFPQCTYLRPFSLLIAACQRFSPDDFYSRDCDRQQVLAEVERQTYFQSDQLRHCRDARTERRSLGLAGTMG